MFLGEHFYTFMEYIFSASQKNKTKDEGHINISTCNQSFLVTISQFTDSNYTLQVESKYVYDKRK